MKPQTVGRVLGVGVRVAGRMAGQRLAGSAQTAAQATAVASPAVKNVQRTGVGVARGVGGFLRPFRRVGGIVFLEVAGVFFLLFVLVSGSWVWRLRASYATGPDHGKFLVAAVMMLAFLYLSVSSFWRARHR